MASRFETAFAESTVGQHLFQHGEDVTYTPSAGIGKTIKAIIERENRDDAGYGGSTENMFNMITIHISSRSNSEGQVTVTELDRSNAPDTVAFDGNTWIVQRQLTPTLAGMHSLLLMDKGAA
jgi:hypothetical protein